MTRVLVTNPFLASTITGEGVDVTDTLLTYSTLKLCVLGKFDGRVGCTFASLLFVKAIPGELAPPPTSELGLCVDISLAGVIATLRNAAGSRGRCLFRDGDSGID